MIKHVQITIFEGGCNHTCTQLYGTTQDKTSNWKKCGEDRYVCQIRAKLRREKTLQRLEERRKGRDPRIRARVVRCPRPMLGLTQLSNYLTLKGSFSAGWLAGKPARSRLYRSQILQVNMRWKALAEIYTMHSFAQLQNHMFF